jgi:hypothetical protein
MASESDASVGILENDEDLQVLLTGVETEFKTIASSLDTCLKGLKVLAKRVKKEGREDVRVTKGKAKGSRLTDVLDLAVGVAKETGTSYGSAVLAQVE